MLKSNLIANFLGQGWVALMRFAFIPLYINYLGIEVYGLIGLYLTLETWLKLLDMGMTPTLSREMARFIGGSHNVESIRDLMRSIEILVISIAILIASSAYLGSQWAARTWLKAESLPAPEVAQAIIIMGLVTAVRYVEGLYRSCLVGLQRQVLVNVVDSSMATLRGLGAVGVLVWVSPSIEAFFFWQGIVSFLSLILLAIFTYSSLPRLEGKARFSIAALRGVYQFLAGTVLITLVSLLNTQIDKLLLSNLLTLSEFGYYTIAVTVAGAVLMVISPITQALYPRLTQLHADGDRKQLICTYHLGAQLVSVIAGSVAIVLIVFAETLLHLWTHDSELSHRVAPLLRLLVLGNLLNGLLHIPFQAQLAFGWTSLGIRIGSIAALITVPSILWAVPIYGAEGAAWVWVFTRAAILIVGAQFMFHRILITEKWHWYWQDIALPIFSILFVVMGLQWLLPNPTNIFTQLATLAGAFIVSLAAASLAAPYIRRRATKYVIPTLRELVNRH
ncbi:MAG: polysaccharide biosynthesis protein [Chloroflexi bacterium]|nr:MAG: polysaccharide biosynthesis protein [Chloroflexota bacterium]